MSLEPTNENKGKGARSDDDAEFNTPLAMSADAKKKLKAFAVRIEHQETEKKALSEDINTLNEEMDDAGIDFKLARKVVKFKQKSKAERDHEQARFQFYLDVVGDD